jgi:NADH-quinone oxidoreductase subunit A
LVVYFAAVIATVIVMLALSSILGQKHREKATAEPFESGVIPVG